MGPKKDKKKDEEPPKGATFTEVERTFLELQVAECNRRIARLKTAVDEYERRNEELQKEYDKLDEDRADIIAYLKKTLNLKNEEIQELKDKVKGLEETREIETTQFKARVAELEKNFSTMKDQLTSENKLLAGKLNTLEEFRAIRDDLMMKFDKQEQDFKDQEMKYKRKIYDAEKKFVIGKDKLKKEMEARLLQLAQDFQDATELRVAASTHRVIRENIAINNELDSILATQAKLAEQNEQYKESERAARVAMEMAEEERDTAINKNVVQLKIIDQLTAAYQDIKIEKGLSEKKSYDFDALQIKIQKLTKDNENYEMQIRVLEQNLHSKLTAQSKTDAEIAKMVKDCQHLKKVLKEAAIAVQAALKLDQWVIEDPTREIMDRQILLSRLLDIITQYREIQHAESRDTLASFASIYEEGDLGFIPKQQKSTSAPSIASTKMTKTSSTIPERSQRSPTASVLSATSLKTVPSMQIIPKSEAVLEEKPSTPSFVTSTQSTVTSEEVAEEELTDLEKAIAASKAEIKKTVEADLAYSQMHLKSQVKFAEEVGEFDEEDIYKEPSPKAEKEDDEDIGEGEIEEQTETGEEVTDATSEKPDDITDVTE